MRIQPLSVVIQFAHNTRKIEIEHKVTVTARRRVLPDIEVTEQFVKLVTCTNVIIVLQDIQRQTLTETAGTDEKEEAIRLLYHRNEVCLIHVIIVFATNIREIHHAVWQTFSVRYYISLHNFHAF